MTTTPPEGDKPNEQGKAKPPPPPLRPINLGAAIMICGALVYNLHLDAASSTYNGAYVTYGLIVGMCLALGLDIDKFWPGRGG